MNCSQCGNELDPGAAFCGNCGAQLTQPVAQPVSAAPQAQMPTPPAQPQAVYASVSQPVPPQPQPPAPQLQPPVPPAPVQPATTVIAASVAPQPLVQPQQLQQAAVMPAYAVPHDSTSAKPVVGLVLGILAPLLCVIPIVGFGLGIAAMVLGGLSLKLKKGMGIAALVLGGIGIVLAILCWIGYMLSAAPTDSLGGFVSVPL